MVYVHATAKQRMYATQPCFCKAYYWAQLTIKLGVGGYHACSANFADKVIEACSTLKNLHIGHILRFSLPKQLIYHTIKSKLAENDNEWQRKQKYSEQE